MNRFSSILCLALASCVSNPDAGKIAAKMTDQPRYVAYERKGKTHTAAVIPFSGVYWCYDGIDGSRKTGIKTSEKPPLLIGKGGDPLTAKWEPVGNPPFRPIQNACLPSAIMKQRLYGGRVVRVSETHVEHVR